MTEISTPVVGDAPDDVNRTWVFWTCFVALIATAFGFMSRVMIIGEWGAAFQLNETQKGEILGAALWPFGISIFLFSLAIDRIDCRAAIPRDIVSRSISVKTNLERRRWVGRIPPRGET